MKHILYASLLLLCLGFIGCQKEEPIVRVSDIILNTTSLSLEEGTSETLIATISPSNATNKTVMWSSSNNSVATVNSQGEVTAIAVGIAIITAETEEGKIAKCSVSVRSKVIHVESISFDKNSIELSVGEYRILVATILPDNVTDRTIIWTSSDEAIATVADGCIHGLSKGEVTITAEAEGKTAECKVTVLPVSAIAVEILNATPTMFLNETQTLSYKLIPEYSEEEAFHWASSDENILTVDETGLCTAISEGVAVVSIYNEDKTLTDEIEIEIKDPYLKVGQAYTSKWGFEVTVNSISVNVDGAKATCFVSYTIKNITVDKVLAECTFSCKSQSGDSHSQYGFFGSVYPDESVSRVYLFDTLSSDPFVELVFSNPFMNEELYPDIPDLVWDLKRYYAQ